MTRQAKTQAMLDAAIEVLSETHPMTVRQVYYQLVARQVVKNEMSRYKAVSDLLVSARKEGSVPWEWIEDRLRRPRHVSMWNGLADFANAVRTSYRRNVWATQPGYVECWLEKDALSGIFEDLLTDYGVTLNVGRGFDGWDSIHNGGQRYQREQPVTVLYFGDFDPSGEDMVRSLRARLAELGAEPEIIKCALTYDDIQHYALPPDFTKKTDSRALKFVEKWGDVSVELDALPTTVLQERLRAEVEERMDLNALERVRRVEAAERQRIVELLASVR
jgi:hypothetical protein